MDKEALIGSLIEPNISLGFLSSSHHIASVLHKLIQGPRKSVFYFSYLTVKIMILGVIIPVT